MEPKGLYSSSSATFQYLLHNPSDNLRVKTGETLESCQSFGHLDQSQNSTQANSYSHPQLHFAHIQISPHAFSRNASSAGNDEAKEFQQSVISERKFKRMVSNRESARRSRMRKKQQIEVLQSQVDQLQSMNHQLSKKLIDLLEHNQQILQENALLKDKASSLQVVIAELLAPDLSSVEEIKDNPGCQVAESSIRTIPKT